MAVDPIIKQKAEDIRHKIYGKEVRESLASGLEGMSEDVVEVTERQATVEEKFQAVIDETTGKDVISAPEIIVARGGATTLGERLDEDKAEVSAQLAHTKSKISRAIRGRGDSIRPIVSFITDDGHDTDFQVLKPISDMYNVPFSMALIPSRPTEITDEHIQEALASGWDFGAHSMTHTDMSTMSEAEIEYEMTESKKRIEARGLAVNYFVYPFNIHNEKVRKVARKHFEFSVAGGNAINPYPLQTYAITRFAFPTGADTIDIYKEQVDIAIENKQWLVFMLHATHHTEAQTIRLKELIGYIKSKEIEIMNMTDAFDIMGNAFTTPNTIQNDKFVLTNQGDIIGSGDNIQKVRLGINAKGAGGFSTVLGNLANGEGAETVAIGIRSHAEGNFSHAIGRNTRANRDGTAVGNLAKANGTYSNAIGSSSETVGTQSNAMGYGAVSTGMYSNAIGPNARSVGEAAIAIGRNALGKGTEAVAIGYNSKTLLASGVAIGSNAEANGIGSTSLGLSAKAEGANSTAIGRGAIASRDNQMTLGTSTTQVTVKNTNGMILTSPSGTEYWVGVRDNGELRTLIVNI